MAPRVKAARRLKEQLLAPPGKKISLRKDFDPAWLPKKIDKNHAENLLAEGVEKLADLQGKLYAQDEWAVLCVFQAMDAAGKDGTIKHVMSGINPQGCQVYSFKAPTSEELDHDYMWRCYKALPERGRIGIFNRSYYEEVLIAKVHPEVLQRQKIPAKFKDKNVIERRYEEINAFEKYLYHQGILVLKFFLNVSKDEQKKRFLERIEQPAKNWKFSSSDAKERGHWDDYQDAYQDCIRKTSTKYAPWYVVPADNKWFMRLAVAAVIYETLESLNLKYPKITSEQKDQLLEAKAILDTEK